MKRLFKILSWLIGLTIVAILLIIAAIFFFIDLNDYKPQIAQFVQQKTGRTLTITSDIHLSFFPRFGLDLGKISLGHPAGFPESTFASIDAAHLRINLLPLLNRQIAIGTILLDGVTLFLTRTADGRTNWEDLIALAGSGEQSSNSKKLGLSINGLDIKNAKIVWDDQVTKMREVLSDLTLKTSALTLNQPIEVNLTTNIENQGQNPITGHLNVSTQVLVDTIAQRYQFSPLQVSIKARGQDILGGQQAATLQIHTIGLDMSQQTVMLDTVAIQMLDEVKLTGRFKIQDFLTNPTIKGQLQLAECNLQKVIKHLGLSPVTWLHEKLFKTMAFQTELWGDVKNGMQLDNVLLRIGDNDLKIPKLQFETGAQHLMIDTLTLQAFGVNVEGNIQMGQIFTEPSLRGKLAVATFNPQEVAKNFSLKLPWNITTATLETQFSSENNQFSLTDLQLNVDNSVLQGIVQIKDFQDPAITFQLDVDSVDVGRYLVADKSAVSKKESASAAGLPALDWLGRFNVNGSFKVAKLVLAGLTINQVAVSVVTKDGKLTVLPYH